MLQALRAALDETRQAIQIGGLDYTPDEGELIAVAAGWLDSYLAPTLYPVINATGVIVHTNLGRAPLSEAAAAAINDVSAGYSNLEYNVASGTRGSRSSHASELLKNITGAEDAMVVNNNASAVLLMLSGLCQGGDVIISRGQLVEIGGGFRVPDVMTQSGAHLVEVGTTNRTHLFDYEKAITAETAALMIAHHSNYQIIGFTSEPTIDEVSQVAHRNELPLLFDQGSGALLDVAPFGLDHEVTVSDGLQSGADIVAFSGDKLLGGPQAGILCGRGDLIGMLKRHPLARAMRPDKTCLAALSATLNHYLRGEAVQEIPVWRMISLSVDDIEDEAAFWVSRLEQAGIPAQIADGLSRVGGGSLPGSSLPTKLVAIESKDVEQFAARLRQAANAVIGRIQDERLLLDPRTLLPGQAPVLLQTVIDNYSHYE